MMSALPPHFRVSHTPLCIVPAASPKHSQSVLVVPPPEDAGIDFTHWAPHKACADGVMRIFSQDIGRPNMIDIRHATLARALVYTSGLQRILSHHHKP
jgi:hypothetical protein